MSDIHVLHVLNSAHGGSALSTLELIGALRKHGIVSSLVCFNNANLDQSRKISELLEGRVLFIPLYWMNKRIRTAFWKRPFLEVLYLLKTWKGYRYQNTIRLLIKENGVNVIHTSTILNPEGAIAARRNKIPHIWHVRELIGPDKHFQFYNYGTWSQFVTRRCNFLIANSSITEECLLKLFSRDKVLCIPNGINTNEFSVKVHTNSHKLIVGMIGSVTTRWKNHEFFIRTASLFSERDNIEFRIYGTLPPVHDPYLVFLKRLILELKAERVVSFKAFAKPPDIIKEIDIMFHTSEFESFGRIFVEAMAGGIPIVAIGKGGSLEMIKDGVSGYLVEGKKPIEAMRRIKLLANSPSLRSDFGSAGRSTVLRKYTIEKLTAQIIGVYESVA